MKTRNTARLILINQKNKIFLMQIKHKDVVDAKKSLKKPFWITAGGKIEPDETAVEAVLRELKEETGITDAKVIEPAAWYGEIVLNWKGEDTLLKENFYITYVTTEEITNEGFSQDEKEVFCANKWWSLEEIANTKEVIIPKDFAELLAPIINYKIHPKKTKTIDLSTPDEPIEEVGNDEEGDDNLKLQK